MKKIFYLPIFLLKMLTFLSPLLLSAGNGSDNIQMAIHLLDYISRDYSAAIEDGDIINAEEYKEMLEFSTTVYEIVQLIVVDYPEEKKNIFPKVRQLKSLVRQKADQNKIAELAQKIKSKIIQVTGYQISPLQWPDLSHGKRLYMQYCMSCHGVKGNGKGQLAQGLSPTPTNFLDDTLMKQVSPFQSFNTIRLGIEGTAMRGFEELKDAEVWDLAFYIKSLRFKGNEGKITKTERITDQALEEVGMTEVATLSDQELLNRLEGNKNVAKIKLASLRLHIPDKDSPNSLHLAMQYLRESLMAYRDGSNSLSRQKALAAYLEGIEPVEAQLQANYPAFVAELEEQMFRLRATIENNEPANVVEEEVNASLAMVSRAINMMNESNLTFWLSFLLSASILLREGLEAFLIIAVMLTIIRSAGIKKALPWLHGGWIAAVLLGFAGWYMSDLLLELSGQDREIIEGVVALVAVGVLTYVGFWLHSNSHAKRWKGFIENKVKKLLKTENMMGLALFSFMVVFREAFESVLFLQAIKLETSPENQSSIGLGVLVAFLIIGILVALFLKYSQKIPVRQLFRYSSWMITLLAIILIGKGIHSIQESGLLSATMIPYQMRIEWLGIYPTVESILGQSILLILILGLWYINAVRNKVHR